MKVPYNVGVGVAAFVFKDGQVIMQKRTGAHGASTWAPPGGKLDFSESPEVGVAREVKEETDLTIGDVTYLGFTNDVFASEGLHYITLWYAAYIKSGTAKITEPHKCLEQKWTSLDAMPQNLFIPTANILKDISALKLLHAFAKESKK